MRNGMENSIMFTSDTFQSVGRALAIAFLAVSLGACNTDELLKVTSPGTLDADKLNDPAQAALIVNGAVADFECAFGAFILVGGIVADEFADSQLAAAGWPYDRRDADTDPGSSYGTAGCGTNQVPGTYTPISVARFTADDAIRRLEEWTDQQVPNRATLIATAALYSGFSYTMLGMTQCEAAIDLSAAMTSQQLFAAAEAKFTKAIDVGTQANATTIVNAARVGRARVRLFQDKKAEAAADARLVPQGFVLSATASDVNTRRQNRVYSSNVFSRFYSIETQSRDLTTGGVPDPRARVVVSSQRGQDGTTIYIQTKYTGFGSPMPVARWEEAQLIIAEAEGGSSAINALNTLRTRAGVPTLSPAEQANLTQTIVEERRRELFVEGFRFYDMRRFNVPFLPTAGTPYPAKGGSYGSTRCFPIPNVERFNNPNLS
jgi:hypothetical protein